MPDAAQGLDPAAFHQGSHGAGNHGGVSFELLDSKMIEVFSSGGGTQSISITALIIQGRLPKPDFTVIADTGREMPTT